MGGARITKAELQQIDTLTSEGLTTREIAGSLNRTKASIRNFRYKKKLVHRLRDETGQLLKQLNSLRIQKTSLLTEVNSLGKEKANLETTVRMDRNRLEQTLTQALINLKLKRPELFYMTGADQISALLRAILG